jgi:hypothetical protein
METKTCPHCRTVNAAYAIVCVNCSARIGEPPQPASGGAGEVGGASPRAAGDDAGQAGWAAPAAPPAGDDGGWGAPPPPPVGSTAPPGVAMPSGVGPLPPQPKRSNPMLLLAIVAAVIIVGAGVVLFLVRGGGGGLPAELNGHPRAESELSSQMESAFDSFDFGGISFDVGLYGEPEPLAMMMLVDGLPSEMTDVPSDVFFQSFASSFAAQGGDLGFDFGDPLQASANGADFVCVDAPAEAFGSGLGGFGASQDGSFCVFNGETVGMIFLFDGTGAAGAMTAAQSAYGELV